MKLKPLGDRVIVRTVDQEDMTASGIVLPDTAQEKPQRGIVLAVGDGRVVDGERIPLEVSDGDEVIYSKYGGTEVKLEGEDVLILSENDILARIGAKAKAPTKRTASRKPAAKKTAASVRLIVAPPSAVSVTASSTASSPKRVVNLITGFMATDDVSLNGSPTVSPMTVAAWRGVPFSFKSTSTTFLALSHAPPAFAMKMAW